MWCPKCHYGSEQFHGTVCSYCGTATDNKNPFAKIFELEVKETEELDNEMPKMFKKSKQYPRKED